MLKRRRRLPYWANWIISIVLFSIIFITFQGLIMCVLFYSSDTIIISMKSMLYLMYLFGGVFFIGGYVIHGWLEVETVGREELEKYQMNKDGVLVWNNPKKEKVPDNPVNINSDE